MNCHRYRIVYTYTGLSKDVCKIGKCSFFIPKCYPREGLEPIQLCICVVIRVDRMRLKTLSDCLKTPTPGF